MKRITEMYESGTYNRDPINDGDINENGDDDIAKFDFMSFCEKGTLVVYIYFKLKLLLNG